MQKEMDHDKRRGNNVFNNESKCRSVDFKTRNEESEETAHGNIHRIKEQH